MSLTKLGTVYFQSWTNQVFVIFPKPILKSESILLQWYKKSSHQCQGNGDTVAVFPIIFIIELTLAYFISFVSVRTPSLWYLTMCHILDSHIISYITWSLQNVYSRVLEDNDGDNGLIISTKAKGLPFLMFWSILYFI